MYDITAYASDIDRARDGLATIRARIESLVEERAALVNTAQAELIAAGVDAITIATNSIGAMSVTGKAPEALFWVNEYWDVQRGLREGGHGYSIAPLEDATRRGLGPEVYTLGLLNARGTYRILLADDDVILAARIPGADDDERGHRQSVARLRTVARRDDMRVRVRDLDISLIDPMDTIVHTGTVLTAFAFLLGVEL